MLTDVVDEAGGVTLVLRRPARGLVAERTVVHQSDRLKWVALWAKAVEKVRKVTRALSRSSELICVGVRWVDKGVGWQKSFLDEPEYAAKIVVDGARLRP